MNPSKKIIWIIICISFGLLISKINKPKNKAAIVTGHPQATKIGKYILEKGGNAIDASIATQLALAVCFPRAGNIGGGGFMVYRKKDGEYFSLDFRERAPLKSSKNMYLDDEGKIIDSLSTFGNYSVGVPGTISGIFDAHEKFGSLSIEELFEPAINIAENGFTIDTRQAELLNKHKQDFIKFNTKNNYFIKEKKWKNGDTLIQKDLANTLKIIRDEKRKGFYDGEITKKIIESLGSESLLSLEDFRSYESIWRKPIISKINEYKIISMPPPSSGGIALSQLIKILFNLETNNLRHNSAQYIHLLSEIEKLVYADRSKYLGDSDFYKVPIKKLLNENYLQNQSKKLIFLNPHLQKV